MLLIAVCDDEALLRENTAALVKKELYELVPAVDCFDSAEALLGAMSAGDYAPDIAILDIQMDGMDGISLAKRLNELAPGCRVIFLTAFLSFATDVYSTEHIYFIVKDELKIRIGEALRRATAALPAAKPALCVQGKQGAQVFPLESVLYLERVGKRTRLVTDGGEHFVTPPPAELLRGAPERFFIRCHQSIWVSAVKIAKLESDEFVLCDGSRLPISRSRKQQAREQFFISLSSR